PAIGAQPGTGSPRRFSGSLPHWVLADTESDAEAAAGESTGEEHVEEASAARHEVEETHAETHGAAGLSDEEAASLSARLVEAKHEEAQARAEADTLVGGAEFDEDEAEALHEAHQIAEREEHGHHPEEEEHDEHEEREEAEEEAHEEHFAAESAHEEHH